MRVLLINPPSPERLGAPLLGLQYVAASLLVARAARSASSTRPRATSATTPTRIVAEAEAFAAATSSASASSRAGSGTPTDWPSELRGRVPLLVAGGAHATVRPDETLEQRLRRRARGEAEDGDRPPRRRARGRTRSTRSPEPSSAARTAASATVRAAGSADDLDALAPPQLAQPLFDPRWYDPSGRDVDARRHPHQPRLPGALHVLRELRHRDGRFRYRAAEDVVRRAQRLARATAASSSSRAGTTR